MSSLPLTSPGTRLGIACVSLALSILARPAGAQGPLQLPAPRGHVNDFAGVVPAAQVAHMEALARFVRDRSGGEIAIVTLPDIGGRDVADVALQIGREWKVGAKAAIGESARNAGVVVLVVPKETSSDGQGHIRIEAGQGVEGFIPDAVAGDIQREGTAYFRQRDYGTGLLVVTLRLAERYAAEFRFSLDSATAAVPRRRASRSEPGGISPMVAIIVFIVLITLLSRGGRRGGCGPLLVGHAIGRSMGRGDRHDHGGFGGGFGGGGSGGGGGFGGFGGGGGFSGGGSSGSW